MLKRIQIKKIAGFTFVSLLILPFISFAAEGDILWSRAYDIGDWDVAYSVAIDSNNNIIVTGYTGPNNTTFNYFTLKYDSNGNILWTKSYDGGSSDQAHGVAIDSDDNIIVTGTSIGTKFNFYTIKYDPNGNVLWTRSYDSGFHYIAGGITVDFNNNVIVVGTVYDGRGENFYTIKYNSNGDVLWSRSYDGGYNDYAYSVATDSNDNIIVGGYSSDGRSLNYFTIKYDYSGNVLWTRSYDGGGYEWIRGIAVDSNDNIIVDGYYEGDNLTIKYDPNGNVLWTRSKSYEGGCCYNVLGIATDSYNNIIITGGAYDGTDSNYFTIKYDSNGNVLWTKSYDGGSTDSARSVATDSNDNIIVTGESVSGTNDNYYTIKYEGPPTIKTISGTIHYENKLFNETVSGDPNATELKSVRFAKVEIIKDSDKSIIGTTKTNEDGTYATEIHAVINDRIYLKCYAQAQNTDYNIIVKNIGGNEYSKNSEIITVNGDTATINLDILADSNEGGSFNIFDCLVEGAKKVKELNGSAPPLVTVYWQKGVEQGTGYWNDVIELNGTTDDPDEYDDAVVLHEYGHFIMDKYSYDKSPAEGHQANDINQDIRLSWSEGWATYFSNLVRNSHVYIDVIKEEEVWKARSLNIETLFHSYHGSLINSAAGQDTEIAVSAILWDIFDNPIGDDEPLGLGGQYIWNVLDNYISNDMDCVLEDFYNGWFSQNGVDFYKTEINNIFSSRSVFYSTSSFTRGPIFTKIDGSPIPDGTGESLNSLLNITDNLSIRNMNVFVDLPHKYKTDLLLTLISPSGKEVILHNHTGPLSGQSQDIFAWYQPPYETIPAESLDNFKRDNSQGNWTLKINDPTNHALMEDEGMLNRWKIEILPNNPPQVGEIDPSSGGSYSEQAVAFSTTYLDSDGWEDIQKAYFLINTSTNGVNCFYAYYDQNENKLYLRNDADTAWLGGFTPGTSNIIENSFVKLDCSQTSISHDTTTLQVHWSVVLKSNFTGTKNTYLYVTDDSDSTDGWVQKGSWTISGYMLVLRTPWYQAEKSYYSAVASSKIILDYIRQDNILTQSQIHNYVTTDLRDLNPEEIKSALNHFKPAAYNFGIIAQSDINDALRDIAHWMDYEVPNTSLPNTPVIIPTFGGYDNWMVVRGVATDQDPNANQHTWQTSDFTIDGFWLSDPAAEGIGEQTYKTAADLANSYYLALATNDTWNTKFVAVTEPPLIPSSAQVKIAEAYISKYRKELNVLLKDNDQLSDSLQKEGYPAGKSAMLATKKLKGRLKRFDWRSVIEPPLLKDPDFNTALKNTTASYPIKVTRLDRKKSDYYLVPFNKSVKGNKNLTSVVLIIDATNQSFKEASWVKYPITYPRITKEQAIQLVQRKIKKQKKMPLIRADLVWEPGKISTSPYRPFWRVSIGNKVWFVTDEGKVIFSNFIKSDPIK